MVRVKETDQVWTGEDNFILEKPKLETRVLPDTPRIHRPTKIYIRFINPLDQELSRFIWKQEIRLDFYIAQILRLFFNQWKIQHF